MGLHFGTTRKLVVPGGGGGGVGDHDHIGVRRQAPDLGCRRRHLGERVAAVEDNDIGAERRRDFAHVLVVPDEGDLVSEPRNEEAHEPEESSIVGADNDTHSATRKWACYETPPGRKARSVTRWPRP